MTAVLSATDPFTRDKFMVSSINGSNEIDFSSTDYKYWKEKYLEEADIVRETQAELDEFQVSSKELEAELEADLARTEKAKMELMVKVERSELERDDWKAKFVALQTTHNTTTTSLQRELDQLRQAHHTLKIQLRELEMGNDDLERNERAISSSLADVEAKYGKTLEEKILLEHELLDKASVEEECQRLRDEVRDANLEISLLRDQLTQARAYAKAQKRSSTYDSSTSGTTSFKPFVPSSENILTQKPPSDLHLDDLSPALEDVAKQFSRSPSESSTNFAISRNVSSSSTDSSVGHEALMKRAGLPPTWAKSPASSNRTATLSRSQTFSSFIPSRLPSGVSTTTTTPRPAATSRLPTSASASSGTTSKSRGVQMVSEMRARVRNLEQRLHTRVPRLRMGSISMKKTDTPLASTPTQSIENGSPGFKTPEHIRVKRRSADVEYERKGVRNDGDTSGWVLIMEDNMSPSPTKDRDKEQRRLSSPTSSPSPFSMSSRSTNRTSSSKTSNTSITDVNIGKGRPGSRQSGTGRDSMSTVSTRSSISTPTSRPTSPGFSLAMSTPPPGFANSALPTLKRSITMQKQKRASLGKGSPTRLPPSFLQPPTSYRDRHIQSLNLSSADKSLPPTPKSVAKTSRPSPATSQSRIGKPVPLPSGRRSAGSETNNRGPGARDLARWRSGSAAR